MQIMEVASWAAFETLLSNKSLQIQYSEDSTGYDLYAPEGNFFLWRTRILKGTADADDFEDNHQANANQPLEVKGGAGRPMRVASSPQPLETIEHWKGFEVSFGLLDTSKTIYISFSELIYLRGGILLQDNVKNGDKLDVWVQVDVGGGTWVDYVKIMDAVPLSIENSVEVLSPESMAFATNLRLKLTITSTASPVRTYYGYLDYYAAQP